MIETEDDLALFFDEDEFAAVATVQIGDATPFEVHGIFDLRPPFTATNFKGFRGTDDFGEGMGSIAGTSPRFTAPTAKLDSVKAGRATLAIRQKKKGQWVSVGTYVAHRVAADGTGVTIVDLKIA